MNVYICNTSLCCFPSQLFMAMRPPHTLLSAYTAKILCSFSCFCKKSPKMPVNDSPHQYVQNNSTSAIYSIRVNTME